MNKCKVIFKKYKKQTLFAGILVLGLTTLGFDDDLFQIAKNLDVFTSVYKEVNINYVDDINSAKMIKTGVDAMLDGLDPYTEFVPESEIEDYKLHYVSTQYEWHRRQYIQIRSGKILVSEVFSGFPAEKADIRAGDQSTLKINDIDLNGKNNDQVWPFTERCKRRPDKTADKTRRMLTSRLKKRLSRDEIKQPNVSYYGMVEGNMGYIKLDKFLENSCR